MVSSDTHLGWIDARALSGDDPYEFFKAHGIALSDGRQFDAPGFVRLNFGCPPRHAPQRTQPYPKRPGMQSVRHLNRSRQP